MNHYEALGVGRTARPSEIRAAYLRLAREHHPDFHASDAPAERAEHVARMKAVTEAWDVLSDPGRRARYDQRLDSAARPTSKPDPVRTRPEPVGPPGKGWTPRADDVGWMTDRAGWAAERDRILPDEDRPAGTPQPSRLVPVAIFALSVLCGFVGLAMEVRALLAGSLAGVIMSSVLFMVMPLVAMTRAHRHDGVPSSTSRRTPYTG